MGLLGIHVGRFFFFALWGSMMTFFLIHGDPHHGGLSGNPFAASAPTAEFRAKLEKKTPSIDPATFFWNQWNVLILLHYSTERGAQYENGSWPSPAWPSWPQCGTTEALRHLGPLVHEPLSGYVFVACDFEQYSTRGDCWR